MPGPCSSVPQLMNFSMTSSTAGRACRPWIGPSGSTAKRPGGYARQWQLGLVDWCQPVAPRSPQSTARSSPGRSLLGLPAAVLPTDSEVLEEKEGGLAGSDREVLLHLGPFLAAEGRIGNDDVVAVLFLHFGEVPGERAGVDDVRRLDAVPDQLTMARMSGRGG